MLFLIINVVIISKDNSYRERRRNANFIISRIILKNYRYITSPIYEWNNIEEF